MRRSIPPFFVLLWIVLLVACGTPPSPEAELRNAYLAQVSPVHADDVVAPALMSTSMEADQRAPMPTEQPGEPGVPTEDSATLRTAVSINMSPMPSAVPAPEPTMVIPPPATQPNSAATQPVSVRQERHYVFPVQPPSVAHFSACHHDYPASDIFAPRGTPVVAVVDGVIEYVSDTDRWEPAQDGPATRGGLAISLIGDDGVRYYMAHLDSLEVELKPGQRITAGKVLGKVGTTGNARNTDPHLHFGISRPTTPDDWATRRGEINPVPYLMQWRSGGITFPPALNGTAEGACQRLDPADTRSESAPEPTPPPIVHPTPTTSASQEREGAGVGRMAPTYRLRVTRQGMVGMTTASGHIITDNDFFVSLPCRCSLSQPGGPQYQVRLSANGRSVVVPVLDVGPFYTDDDFWEPNRRGHPSLPVGWPADHAAYYQNYQNRQAQLGYVRFPSAVDIGDGAYWALGLKGAQGTADVTFLWLGSDPGPNPSPLPYGSY